MGERLDVLMDDRAPARSGAGVQQVAVSLAGGVAASLSGRLLSINGSYDRPMLVIFVFLVIGAGTTWVLLRPEFAPKVSVARGRPTAPGSDNALRPPRATVVSPPKRDEPISLKMNGNGAGEEDRTLDIHLGKVALYR